MTISIKSYMQSKYQYSDLSFTTPVDFIKYCNWLQSIESFVYEQTGLRLLDLSDQLYRDMYDEGYRVEEMVSLVLEDVQSF